MPDIFDELEEDLRAERARAIGRRYAGLGVAALILILGGTGAYVYWQQRSLTAVNTIADRFITAAGQADRAATPAGATDTASLRQAETTLSGIAASGPAGYQTVARLRLAALQWRGGQHAQAIATWQALTDDASAPTLLRDLATLTSAEHQLDAGDPLLLRQRLESLTGEANPWRPMAQLVIALLDVRTAKPREAGTLLRRLAAEPMVPDSVRQMATDLLTTLPADATAEPAPHAPGHTPPHG